MMPGLSASPGCPVTPPSTMKAMRTITKTTTRISSGKSSQAITSSTLRTGTKSLTRVPLFCFHDGVIPTSSLTFMVTSLVHFPSNSQEPGCTSNGSGSRPETDGSGGHKPRMVGTQPHTQIDQQTPAIFSSSQLTLIFVFFCFYPTSTISRLSFA